MEVQCRALDTLNDTFDPLTNNLGQESHMCNLFSPVLSKSTETFPVFVLIIDSIQMFS